MGSWKNGKWVHSKAEQRQHDQMKAREDARDAAAARIASRLPEGEAELIRVARRTIRKLDQAVRDGDMRKTFALDKRYQAIVWKLHGGSFFGCLADKSSGGRRLERGCRARAGQPPKWGQRGQFLIEFEGIRAWVEASYRLSQFEVQFEFHAIDLGLHFISETGFRSGDCRVPWGQTVRDAAIAEALSLPIGPIMRERHFEQPLPKWLRGISRVIAPPLQQLDLFGVAI